MRYDHYSMLPERAFLKIGGRMTYEGGGKGSSPSAPDYGPTAAASEHAAVLGKELGDAQLAESTRQYNDNMKVAAPIVDAQLGMMTAQQAQGDDYYDYMVKNQRPVESALNTEAMAAGSQSKQDEASDKAQADTLNGYTRSLNIAARQGLRYGFSPEKLAAQAGTQAGSQATALATAANGARTKEKELGFAKKMDVAGLYRGLAGASTGAYGSAAAAGNSANSNQMAPGQALMGGMAQGANMQQTGMGQNLQGNLGILQSQGSVYSAGQQAAAGASAGQGQMVGAGLGIAAAMI